jgi:hypothetical protein
MQELSVAKVQDVILETQEDKTHRDLFIHKSPCAGNETGAIFFAISGTPPRGYALFLPKKEEKNQGMLHVFDELGLKRKIIHCRIIDLDRFKDNDVCTAKEAIPVIEVQ